MSKITFLIGDATAPVGFGKKIICHITNDEHRWGAGFVKALSKKWQAPELQYRNSVCTKVLGHVQFVEVEYDDIIVANMTAQHSVGYDKNGIAPIRYDAVRECLIKVNEFATAIGATIHAPRFGCGLAGGEWSEIAKIIKDTITVDIYIYDLK
jgi:O-acetyl-ADP-ribose deacetylase (regulator of RNase III)